jgi:hypothetical protein
MAAFVDAARHDSDRGRTVNAAHHRHDLVNAFDECVRVRPTNRVSTAEWDQSPIE